MGTPATPGGDAQAARDSDDRSGRRVGLWVTLGALLLLVVLGLMIKSMAGKPAAAKRQVARISVLPDTPPPPPPKLEKPPEPKEAPKQMPREEQVRQPDAAKAADAPLKMEGPAGNGPSAFAGGAVTQDYKGGPVSSGPAGGGTQSDRAQERFYANTARQLLRDELDRRLGGDISALVVNVSLWIGPDGAIRRFELQPSGNARADAELRTALDDTTQALRLPPLPANTSFAQPMRFRLTLRSAG